MLSVETVPHMGLASACKHFKRFRLALEVNFFFLLVLFIFSLVTFHFLYAFLAELKIFFVMRMNIYIYFLRMLSSIGVRDFL